MSAATVLQRNITLPTTRSVARTTSRSRRRRRATHPSPLRPTDGLPLQSLKACVRVPRTLTGRATWVFASHWGIDRVISTRREQCRPATGWHFWQSVRTGRARRLHATQALAMTGQATRFQCNRGAWLAALCLLCCACTTNPVVTARRFDVPPFRGATQSDDSDLPGPADFLAVDDDMRAYARDVLATIAQPARTCPPARCRPDRAGRPARDSLRREPDADGARGLPPAAGQLPVVHRAGGVAGTGGRTRSPFPGRAGTAAMAHVRRHFRRRAPRRCARAARLLSMR